MSLEPSSHSGTVPFGPYQTSYIAFGPLPSPRPPLIILHGGPGCTHEYMLNLRALHSRFGISIIMYDQIGCGRSSHLHEQPEKFELGLFLDELQNLIDKLGLREYDLLGHSWGGELALEHSLLQPPGLRKLIIAGCGASVPLGNQMRRKLYDALPPILREATYAHEVGRADEDGEVYGEARREYWRRHMIRTGLDHEAWLSCVKCSAEDPTSHDVMMGTTDIWTTGKMEHWSVIPRLHLIQAPTLVLHGAYDFLGGEAVQPLLDGIGKVKGVRFEEASHMVHVEEEERFLEEVGRFLISP